MDNFYNKIEKLPICEKLDELIYRVKSSGVSILNSSPGSGKSTVVPIVLLRKLLGEDGKIIMLEPRRLAAKMVACRMADLLGEKVGETIGYIFKGEKCTTQKTRIEVVTEGVFTKIIQKDPFLSDYKIVVFDEFHERNINSDLGLAFSLDVQKGLREDLKILLMSGSIKSDELSEKLSAESIVSAERTYDLQINYLNASMRQIDLDIEVVKKVSEIINENQMAGDILVFLSGAGEINRIADRLFEIFDDEKVVIHRLYGALERKAQDEAVAPDKFGRRKVILSSNICESSVTIENINFVIDSGWEKHLIYDLSTEMNRLTRMSISQSSAIQRANRAGRTGAGVVYRLYSERDYLNFPENITPEIEEIELSDFVLELSQWGSRFDELFFMVESSIDNRLAQAYNLLRKSGIIDENNCVTSFGKRVYNNSASLRYGIMIEKAKVLNLQVLACEITALLSENIVDNSSVDIEVLLQKMRNKPRVDYSKNLQQLLKINNLKYEEQSLEYAGLLLGFAYPEFIGRRRADSSFVLANGFGCKLYDGEDLLAHQEFLVAAKLDRSNQANGIIYLAAMVKKEDLEENFAEYFREEQLIEYSSKDERFYALKRRYFQKILLDEKPSNLIDQELLQNKIRELIKSDCLNLFELTNKANSLWHRIEFAWKNDPETFVDFDPEILNEKIAEYLFGCDVNLIHLKSLKKLDFFTILNYSIRVTDRKLLDNLYPEYYETPCGSRILLDYSGNEIVLRVKITEMYGVKIHPTVGIKKLPIKIELLSPASRVIQITGNLPDFWQNNYKYVQKEMKSSYIKHFWPDNPMEAVPTKKTKNKM